MVDEQENQGRLARREAWAYRLSLAAMAVFTVLGVVLLYHPSDALTDVYVVALLITLALGLLSGVVAVYSS